MFSIAETTDVPEDDKAPLVKLKKPRKKGHVRAGSAGEVVGHSRVADVPVTPMAAEDAVALAAAVPRTRPVVPHLRLPDTSPRHSPRKPAPAAASLSASPKQTSSILVRRTSRTSLIVPRLASRVPRWLLFGLGVAALIAGAILIPFFGLGLPAIVCGATALTLLFSGGVTKLVQDSIDAKKLATHINDNYTYSSKSLNTKEDRYCCKSNSDIGYRYTKKYGYQVFSPQTKTTDGKMGYKKMKSLVAALEWVREEEEKCRKESKQSPRFRLPEALNSTDHSSGEAVPEAKRAARVSSIAKRPKPIKAANVQLAMLNERNVHSTAPQPSAAPEKTRAMIS